MVNSPDAESKNCFPPLTPLVLLLLLITPSLLILGVPNNPNQIAASQVLPAAAAGEADQEEQAETGAQHPVTCRTDSQCRTWHHNSKYVIPAISQSDKAETARGKIG